MDTRIYRMTSMPLVLKEEILLLLQSKESGISEHQLHQTLENHPDMIRHKEHNKLVLFQKHFKVMNALYQIQTEQKNLVLEITAMRIRIVSKSEFDRSIKRNHIAIAKQSTLAAWYLDWDNYYRATEESVQNLLDQFWHLYANIENREAALKILGLNAPSTNSQIKDRYHKLALQHHPDKGGEAKDFHQIQEAVFTLIGKFQ